MGTKTNEEILNELHVAFNDYKNTNDKRIKEIEKGGSAPSDVVEKLMRLDAAINELEEVKRNIELVEAKLIERPKFSDGDEHVELKQEHLKSFDSWIRNPYDEKKLHELKDVEKRAIDAKAVTIGTTTAGGHAVPEALDRAIAEKQLEISDLRTICNVVQVGTSDYKKLVDELGAASGWAGEGDTRSETGTPTLQEVAPTMGELYAVPKASEWSLDDIFFNVEQWLASSVAREFAYQEGEAFVTGNGTNKPTGILGGTPESNLDGASPRRTFGELQYVAGGHASLLQHDPTGSPLVYGGDKLIELVMEPKAFYRNNARFAMNKGTLEVIRKWKDVDGQYIWQPSLQMGMPSILLGYPVSEMEAMPAIGANAFPIAFGNFKEAYTIVDRVGTRITVDPYTSKGHILFYIRKRVGGKVVNDEAVKLIKIATS